MAMEVDRHDIAAGNETSHCDDGASPSASPIQRAVHFGNVFVREYEMTMGENPATSIGAPVCLTWDYTELEAVSLDSFETKKPKSRSKRKNRSPSEFYLSYYKRESILKKAGFSKQEFDQQERKIQWERFRRKLSRYESFPILFIKSFFVGHARRKSRRFVKRYRKNQQH